MLRRLKIVWSLLGGFMSKLNFITNDSFKKIAIFLIAISSVLIFYNMMGRSIWIDEGMLLKSIFTNSFLDFINPLPYYDQAQPFIASIVHKLISLVSIKFEIMRAILLVTCLVPIIFFVIKISQNAVSIQHNISKLMPACSSI